MKRVLLLALVFLPAPAQKWTLEFFHDVDRQKLLLNDIRMLTPQRGIAIGVLLDGRRMKPMSAITSNGGRQWTLQPLPDGGVSLFFLDDSTGWLVGEGGVWETLEGGRGWKRILKRRDLERVWFVNKERGFAAGRPKTVLETRDAGKTWKPVAVAKEPPSSDRETVYNWITFESAKRGIITGFVQPRRLTDPDYPIWMDPYPSMRPEWPRINIFLITQDGGDTWRGLTSSLFGHVARFKVIDRDKALVLLRYDNYFRYPSELVLQDRASQTTQSLFKSRDRSITDFYAAPDGTVYIAGVETMGTLGTAPVAGKVKVLRSRDWKNWDEMNVDYRASATRVLFAGLDEKDIRLATDSGMILRLTP